MHAVIFLPAAQSEASDAQDWYEAEAVGLGTSRAVILTIDTINALLAREAARASACLGLLGAEAPDYGALNALETLSRALSGWPLRMTNPVEIATAVGRMEGEVHPAALAAMGSKAADFMRPFWYDLAHAACLHAYDAACPQSCCAGLYSALWGCSGCGEGSGVDSNCLRRPRTFAIAVECSATQGHAKRRFYIFVYS